MNLCVYILRILRTYKCPPRLLLITHPFFEMRPINAFLILCCFQFVCASCCRISYVEPPNCNVSFSKQRYLSIYIDGPNSLRLFSISAKCSDNVNVTGVHYRLEARIRRESDSKMDVLLVLEYPEELCSPSTCNITVSDRYNETYIFDRATMRCEVPEYNEKRCKSKESHEFQKRSHEWYTRADMIATGCAVFTLCYFIFICAVITRDIIRIVLSDYERPVIVYDGTAAITTTTNRIEPRRSVRETLSRRGRN